MRRPSVQIPFEFLLNSVDQIFLKLNWIIVNSRTALLKVALLKELLYDMHVKVSDRRMKIYFCIEVTVTFM